MDKQTAPMRGGGGYLEALLTSCPAAILATNSEGTITFANREACKLAEREMHELVGKTIATIYESLDAARETNRKIYENGGIIRDHESRARTKSGRLIPVRISAVHMTDSSGKHVGAVGFFEVYRPWTVQEAQVKAHADALEARLEQQGDLGAPVLQVYPGLSVLAITGTTDAERFTRLTANLPERLRKNNARVLLVDFSLTDFSDDEAAAAELVKTVRTLHLLGIETVLSGIKPATARAMEPKIGEIGSVRAAGTPELALQLALGLIGCEISRKV